MQRATVLGMMNCSIRVVPIIIKVDSVTGETINKESTQAMNLLLTDVNSIISNAVYYFYIPTVSLR